MIAVVLPALALAAAGAPNLGVLHQYASVALSADGRKIASVETVRTPYATTGTPESRGHRAAKSSHL